GANGIHTVSVLPVVVGLVVGPNLHPGVLIPEIAGRELLDISKEALCVVMSQRQRALITKRLYAEGPVHVGARPLTPSLAVEGIRIPNQLKFRLRLTIKRWSRGCLGNRHLWWIPFSRA